MTDRKVAIFRKRLLPYSETFIADQGRFLPRRSPVYCGYRADASGIGLLGDAERLLLSDYSRAPGLAKALFRLGLGGGAWTDAIGARQPTLVHAHFYNDGVDALRLGARLGIPVVTTLHGHDITKHANGRSAARDSRRFFERVDRVIAVSDFIARQALERGCPESRLLRHYIGIDLDRFTQAKRESATPSLLFVGRLVEKKGCTYLLQAMQKLKAAFPELRLTVVGDGHLRPSLQAEAEERGVAVEFAGTESPQQVRERLAACWLFTGPSVTAASGDAEGLGMVFLEAQALRTPVISFASGGVVEAVADGETGLLCAERDVDALAANIARLLADDALRRRMGDAGRVRVESRFNIRRQCELLENLYDELS